MKEEQLKTLMQQSRVETSDDFMDTLMQKVKTLEETPTVQVPSFRKIALISLIGLIFISFISYKYVAPFLSEIFESKTISRIPLYAIFLIVSLLGVNYILRLHQTYRRLS
ncbi:hypothetical protein [uncultured Kordia sp.]|uniref:hypothetical protein n=1 Tax=uncultured Kordia sp. TaxID=507699 RepID=UPI0026383202|nr:hypothetical protein [uncultured Kordia sp.]